MPPGVTVAPDDKGPRQSPRSAAINPKSSLRDGFRRSTWVFSVKMARTRKRPYTRPATASGSRRQLGEEARVEAMVRNGHAAALEEARTLLARFKGEEEPAALI